MVEVKCKHKWVYGQKNGLGTTILCQKCGIIREIYSDGFIEFGCGRGVYT